jgi:hypothetical protein
MNQDTTTEPQRCLATNTPHHANPGQCRLPAYAHGLCKRHARAAGITKLCLTCGLWHEPGRHRRAGRTE